MAQALICDLCGQTFACNYQETATGKWCATTKVVNGKIVRLVYAAFQQRLGDAENSRGGKPLDICPKDMALLVIGEVKETDNVDLPRPGEPQDPAE